MITRRGFFGTAAATLLGGRLAAQSPCTDFDLPDPESDPANPNWSANWRQIDWEREKLEKQIPTDLIVLHHTEGFPGMGWKQLSSIQHQTVYAYVYKHVINPQRPSLKGTKPHSGHYRLYNGRLVEVFYAYHWLVRNNGAVERLLEDKEVGWHCSNWDENMRSIAICFDGNFTHSAPPQSALEAAAGLIRDYASKHPIKRLKPHSDFNKHKTCPGSWFHQPDSDGVSGRAKLLKLAGVQLAE